MKIPTRSAEAVRFFQSALNILCLTRVIERPLIAFSVNNYADIRVLPDQTDFGAA